MNEAERGCRLTILRAGATRNAVQSDAFDMTRTDQSAAGALLRAMIQEGLILVMLCDGNVSWRTTPKGTAHYLKLANGPAK